MCLIAFAINASTRWPLVIASNRDEFLNRPTLPLARWHTDAGTEIISGRDLRAGGTWLGLSPGGRLAMLTNVRERQPTTGEKSRGELVLRWLEGRMDAAQFMAQTDSAAYGAFNLVLGDFQAASWHWLTNRSEDATGWHSRALGPGIYGLSNGALDTPWPKTRALKHALQTALAAPGQDALRTELWSALQDRRRASAELLPSTGVPLAQEHALSSAFVDFPENGYGTRCSTLLVASAVAIEPALTWDVRVEETTHAYGGSDARLDHSCQLTWQPSPAFASTGAL
ncbi:MAG: NRDE family protein [Polaromonas sp.]|nr:NRDE family protein [Polaromonas sp.]